MPVVGLPYKRYEIYCPVCGYKYISEPYIEYVDSFHPIIVKVVEHTLKSSTRYINFECERCKTKLVYDRKRSTIKIKK